MSYAKDLDEYPEAQLIEEINRRAAYRAQGLCDYCHRSPETPTCKEKERHTAAERPKAILDHGWAWPLNSRKAHYFTEGRSLCGKWMYLGKEYQPGNDDSVDNCTACRLKRAAQARQAQALRPWTPPIDV